ncbi:flagellar biosynthesis anti-sigma factor FlgM [Chitinilyticum piscinae]|nr:flagellar biosynthesis anti-sigma factor FlgM [Chitinilyticum piscinae]
MKIDSQGKPLAPTQLRSGETKAANSSKSSESPTISGENVQLGAGAAVGQTESSFDAEKVAAIRQAIAEGRFQVKPEAIANGLLDSVKELLER